MPHADEALGRSYAHDHTTADRTGPLTNDEHDGFIEIALSSTPSTPASGKMRLFAEDANGVARLRAVHSTGSNLAFFRDAVVRCRNNSGVTINKGEIVYITGATGNAPTVAKARANSASTMPAAGMATTTATNNSFVTVQFFGEIIGLDTSAFAEGDKLWASAATAGAVTATEPMHPYFSQPIGWVTKSNAGDGRIHLYTTLTHEGDDSGTNRNEFHIGDAAAGTKRLVYHAAVHGYLDWAPTTSDKTITLPDSTGTVALVGGSLGAASATTFTASTLTLNAAGSTTTPQLDLAGATNNWMRFAAAGVAAPAFTTRSLGTKVVLYPTLSGSALDIGMGVESGYTWFSNNATSAGWRFYAGSTTPSVTISGLGAITCTGLTSNGTGGIGYAIGSGGTATQVTSKATAVAINFPNGEITTHNAALAAGATVSFTLSNVRIAAADMIAVHHVSGGTVGDYDTFGVCAANAATIYVRNRTAGSLSDALVLRFAVTKTVSS